MNARAIAILVLIGVVAVAADDNCNVPGFFESYCQHGGVCQDVSTTAGYSNPTCLCPTPSIGTACSYNVRECRDNPCVNGGSCRNMPSAPQCDPSSNYDCFRCSCPPGWGAPTNYGSLATNEGGICDTPRPLKGCQLFPCQNGGTCQPDGNPSGYTCDCDFTGFTGRNCTFNCTRNAADTCQNGGTCTVGGTEHGKCNCATGYTGYDCSVPLFCTTSPCMNGATCNPSGTCTCASGWSGKFCNVVSFCSSNPCTAGGTCRDDLRHPDGDVGGVGACQCPSGYNSGYIGGNFVDYGIKNCTTLAFCGTSPCQNSATCVPNGNDGTCTCRAGFAGKYCEIDLTTVRGCYNRIQGQQCFDGSSGCPCTSQGSCRNNFWNVKCNCPAVSSVTGLGYADCRCNSTYVPKCPTVTGAGGVTGADIGDAPCQNGGSCWEHANGWGCNCRPGYYGSRCESYHNPCSSSPCQNNGNCQIITETDGDANMLTDTYWTYRCQCKYPYYGRECQNKVEDPANVCTNTVPAPVCMNGGSCIPASYNWNYQTSGIGGGGFFYGQNNGGLYGKTVRVEYSTWFCQCPPGFHGLKCEYPTGYNPRSLICGVNWPPGASPTCKNGGTCIDSSDRTQPRCACPCGFSGEYCEVVANGLDATIAAGFIDNYGVKMDYCGTNICQNGGSCVTTRDWQGAQCNCAAGYYGYYCQFQGLAAGANVLPSAIIVAAAAIVAAALRM